MEVKLRDNLRKNKKLLILAVCAVLILTVPFVITDGLIISILTYIMLYSVLSMSSMVVIGYGGMLNLGHAAFYGIGAYVSALLSIHLDLPFLACFIVSGLVAALFGFILSVPCLRVSADFLGLITLAFLELFRTVINNWIKVTRGPMGLTNIKAASILGFDFNSEFRFYFLMLGVFVLVYFFLSRLMKSPFGRALQAVRDDEIGAGAVGIDANYYKVMAFVVGAGVAGLAGSMVAHYLRFVGPTSFVLDTSFLIIQMNILGGLGSLTGGIVGAAFFTIMPEIIRPLAEYRLGIGGLIMLLVILIRPQGIMGSRAFAGKGGILNRIIRKLLDRLQQKKQGS